MFCDPLDLHSFPTRRSSDLVPAGSPRVRVEPPTLLLPGAVDRSELTPPGGGVGVAVGVGVGVGVGVAVGAGVGVAVGVGVGAGVGVAVGAGVGVAVGGGVGV